MALFGRDYDRDYGYRGGSWGRGIDRTNRGGWNAAGGYDSTYLGMTRDDRGWGMERDRSRETGRGNRMWGMGAYDREFSDDGGYGAMGYDRGYKSRWQTDFGDPFGDRAARTPMRMIRGGYRSGYDHGFRGSEQGSMEYGRDYYEANPMGYDPYDSPREGTWMRGGERSRRMHGRGYDAGWF